MRAALVVAPHPDDETIGAFGLIRALARRGVRVRVVIVTDGAASHANSAAWPKPRLVAERRRETRRELRRLGVPAGDISFLGLPDGALAGCARQETEALVRAVKRVPDLDLLVAPSEGDAHPDHRAAAAIVSRAGRKGLRRLAYVVWPRPGRRAERLAGTLALGAARLAKRAAIRRYRTQTGAIADDPTGFAISRGELARFAAANEHYLEARR